MRYLMMIMIFGLLQACGDGDRETGTTSKMKQSQPKGMTKGMPSSAKRAFFGDLHVHTMYSFDAFVFGTTASPDDAYEFAKGGRLRHPGGFDMELVRPLDFYGVSDHAFYLGSFRAMADPTSALGNHELAAGIRGISDIASRVEQFAVIRKFLQSDKYLEILDEGIFMDAWEDIKAAAQRHNDPGRFTTFIAYEYTTTSGNYENLHRNVVFADARAPDLPFSRIDSVDPEDLWRWMDGLREQGMDAVAIPHNSNGSNGSMFKLVDYGGNPLSAAYADLRMRNEPLVEITQIKGTSETHPALSPNDEWADFEIMPYRIATTLASQPSGSYVREALGRGVALESQQGFNPFHFGVIGSSDTHNASYAGDENNYWSKVSLVDDTPKKRGTVPLGMDDAGKPEYADVYFNTWGASGLAGVWAEENTREAIFAAFKRKETFGTSGTRMQIRFFAGYGLVAPELPDSIEIAYAKGVPMGGDLVGTDRSPEFLVMAVQDVRSAALQRLQIIKVAFDNGKTTETVFDVACSDGSPVNPSTHRCADNGASVNLADCSFSQPIAAAELRTKWVDPIYKPSQRAVYYARVLENPTCRWSTWDAIRSGVSPRADLAATIQERAWSSPIWISPTHSE